MHKATEFKLKQQCNRYVDDRIIDIVQAKIDEYNRLKNMPAPQDIETTKTRSNMMKELFLEIVYNLPSGFELTANVVVNYLQLKTQYQQRRHHALPEWQMYCDWCLTLPLFKELCVDRNK